jgi:hypothetical protein
MRAKAILTSVAVVMLAACSADPDTDGGGAVSMEAAADAAAASMPRPEPGQYRATITMKGIQIPGLPAEMAGHGSGMTTTNEYCLTPDDVADGYQEMMKRGQDGQCTYERFSAAGGKLDAVMVCKTPEGGARMEMTGTASGTASEFDATMAMNIPGQGEGTMKFNAKHERIGDCP